MVNPLAQNKLAITFVILLVLLAVIVHFCALTLNSWIPASSHTTSNLQAASELPFFPWKRNDSPLEEEKRKYKDALARGLKGFAFIEKGNKHSIHRFDKDLNYTIMFFDDNAGGPWVTRAIKTNLRNKNQHETDLFNPFEVYLKWLKDNGREDAVDYFKNVAQALCTQQGLKLEDIIDNKPLNSLSPSDVLTAIARTLVDTKGGHSKKHIPYGDPSQKLKKLLADMNTTLFPSLALEPYEISAGQNLNGYLNIEVKLCEPVAAKMKIWPTVGTTVNFHLNF